jgi:polysaccharide export outer membrane protein
MLKRSYFFFIFLFILSCAGYKQHIMLKPEDVTYTHDLEYARFLAERNYRIHVNDKLEIKVYTNEGERIIDPDYELQKDLNINNIRREESIYLIQKDGRAKIPMVGEVELEGLTLSEAEQILEEEYGKYYKDPYVILRFTNKRVVVLGIEGGHVIPLENEDMNLFEVLALAGGIPKDMKVQNIRIIRGDLSNPDVQVVDLSTIQGMQSADLNIYPGDIVYVEPVVRVFSESTRELIPLISIITSFVALILALQRF